MTPAGGWPRSGYKAVTRSTLEIQRFLIANKFLAEGQDDGVWGGNTSEGTAKFQQTRWLLPDGIWGSTTDGIAFPPAGSVHGIDYSFARPDPKMLAARGVRFAGRYLWEKRYPGTKGLSRAEYEALSAAGVGTFLIYEEDGKELAGGFEAGVRVAKLAEAELAALSLPGRPVFFNVDYDAPSTALPAILEALRGIASVLGIKRTGLYAGLGPIKAAFDAGVITWGFQTYAWSNGQWDPRAQLQQWSNGQWGDSVDFTRAIDGTVIPNLSKAY